MKHLLFLSLIFSFSVKAQVFQCGTVEPPNSIVLSPQVSRMLADDPTIRTIPLVFHIVWNPSLFPNDSALAASKINSYVSIAQKFMRKQNPDTAQTVPAFRSVMADAKIEFCLKQVIYKRTTEPSFTTNDKIKFLPTGSPAIDPFKHCNVWLGRLTGSLGGYAYFPSSGSVGQPFDGIVSVLALSNDEQVAEIIVHELLHYLGVYHTFSNLCTGDGDFCADTPPTNSPSGCVLTTQKCGTLTQVQNVMDYAHCATGLTKDQSARCTATLIGLRNELWNSGTCGTNPPPPNTPPQVAITQPANGQQFTAPTSFYIRTTATDDGFVAKVEFRMNNVLVFTDNQAPFEVAVGVPAGTYILTAKAYDNLNLFTTSAPVTITVNAQSTKEPILEHWIENNRHYIRTARKTYSVAVQ